MRHLDHSELIDLIEMQLAPSRAEHLDECDACRAQAAMLRSALAGVRDDERHEPSPLFWDHFAARVSDAIRDQAPPIASAPAWFAWLRRPATAWATSASIAMLLMVTALWRATLHAPIPRPVHVAPSPVAAAAAPVAVPDDVEADRAWAVVRTATDDLAWEDVAAAGIIAHPGSAEGVALELTADERTELARLLASEMKQSGAS